MALDEAVVAVTNGRVVLPDGVRDDLAVVCRGGTIESLSPSASLGSRVPTVDVGGRWVTPGLVDIHAHGALGRSFNDADPEGFAQILAEFGRCGTTSVVATLGSGPLAQLTAALQTARDWPQAGGGGSALLGVHLEGPFVSVEQRGAHDPRNLRTPDDGAVDEILAYADVLTMVTFAAELPGAVTLARRVADAGVVPAVGHSNATERDMEAVVEAGVRHVVHLWSGQSTTTRDGPWRRPGLLEWSLASDGISAEVIADGRHLPAALLTVAYRCLRGRLCAVSDATAGAGLPEGSRFRLGGGPERVVRDGVAMLADGTSFAGSTTLLNRMVPILVDAVGMPVQDAVAMATAIPAGVVGLGGRKGRLAPGMDADVAVFEDDFTPWMTMAGGRWLAGT